MTLATYIKGRGLRVQAVADKMGVRRQALYPYGGGTEAVMPHVSTMERIAAAMTELGAPTSKVDLFVALTTKPIDTAEG